MKRMLCLLLVFFLLAPCTVQARAEAFDASDGFHVSDSFDLSGQLDALGAGELPELLPDEARELMDEAGVGEMKVESLLHLSPGDFFQAVWKAFLTQLRGPLKMLGVLLGITLLCALLGGMREGLQGGGLSEVFGLVAVLCMISSAAAPVLDCIVSTVNSIRNASVFMLGYIPVFAAAVTASGQPLTGAAYNAFLFATCQMVAQVVSQTLLPLMSIYLALCIAGGLSTELNIAALCAAVKRTITWSLGFLTTIFVGVLSVQTMVTGSADSLAVRASKFVISGFVPVVGSALSEAMLAAQGCLKLIRASVGAFGIAAALFIFLPVFLKVLIWMGVTNLAAMCSDLLGVKEVSGILRSCSSVLGILISFLLCYALLMIVAVTVVMVTGLGTG